MRSLGENTNSAQTFGAYLREQREAKSLSLRQFAQMVGIAPSYESNIENGTAPPPAEEVICRMALVLGLREGALLARAGKLKASTLVWFWSQPIVQETLACASGMREADARMYVLTVFEDIPSDIPSPVQGDYLPSTFVAPASEFDD